MGVLPGQKQQFLGEALQARHLRARDAQQLVPAVRLRGGGLQTALDDGERGAQLVAGGGDEFVLLAQGGGGGPQGNVGQQRARRGQQRRAARPQKGVFDRHPRQLGVQWSGASQRQQQPGAVAQIGRGKRQGGAAPDLAVRGFKAEHGALARAQCGAAVQRFAGEQCRRAVLFGVFQRHAVVFQIVKALICLLLLGQPAVRQRGGPCKAVRHCGGSVQKALVAGLPQVPGLQKSARHKSRGQHQRRQQGIQPRQPQPEGTHHGASPPASRQ